MVAMDKNKKTIHSKYIRALFIFFSIFITFGSVYKKEVKQGSYIAVEVQRLGDKAILYY